jgi:DNA uptake protein ComE-like DNA-binding protein
MKRIHWLFILAVIIAAGIAFQIREIQGLEIELEATAESAQPKAHDEPIRLTTSSEDQGISNIRLEAGTQDHRPKGEELTDVEKINLWTKAQWMDIKGIGEVTAQRILVLKEERQGFRSLEELLDVKGIGPAKFQSILESLKKTAAVSGE